MNHLIGLGLIIRLQVQAEIMPAAHIPMHQIFHRNHGAFTGLDDHRTDGRRGRSTPFPNFDVRLFGEAQRPVPHVGDVDIVADQASQLNLTVVDEVRFNFQP